jgi:thymidylate synthase (FAD)
MNALDELRGKVFPVLDDGHVILKDVMGDDHSICDDARQTTGSSGRDFDDDRNLIRYLVRNQEMSPFEMATIKFHLRLPMETVWHLTRYRTAKLQVYSGRYREMIDSMHKTASYQWRLQAKGNRQGSSGMVTEWPKELRTDGHEAKGRCESPGTYLSRREEQLHQIARQVYKERLAFGVAREQSRKDLPLSIYTEMVWKFDLRNLLWCLYERMSDHDHGKRAQWETSQYANVIGNEIVARLFPVTWSAFQDYVLNSLTLSSLDIHVIAQLQSNRSDLTGEDLFWAVIPDSWRGDRCRERDECRAKLIRLGMMRGLG